jgi:hypothetical protein
MKKRVESPDAKKSSRKHDALLITSKKLFAAIFSSPLRGGEIDFD